MSRSRFVLAGLSMALAGCGGEAPSNESAAAPAAQAANEASAEPSLPSCPFRSTANWRGSVEGGRLLVTGQVDLMMAGFRPELSPRSGASGVLALELRLAPDPTAAVNDQVRYERSGSPSYRQGQIWCGGERIATFEVINVG
jgi:hypothetical protein